MLFLRKPDAFISAIRSTAAAHTIYHGLSKLLKFTVQKFAPFTSLDSFREYFDNLVFGKAI